MFRIYWKRNAQSGCHGGSGLGGSDACCQNGWNGMKFKHIWPFGLISLFVLGSAVWCAVDAGVGDDLRSLAGGKRVKLVWQREVGATNQPFGGGTYRLMGFDTESGSESDVLGESGNFARVKMTLDARRVVFNQGRDLYKVDFTGGGKQLVTTDAALGCMWYDEGSGKDYAIVGVGPECLGYPNTQADVYKVNIDEPSDRQLLYAGEAAVMWLSITTDGTQLGGHFPWSNGAGIVTIASGQLTVLGGGCWGSVSPDGARYGYLDGEHRNWVMTEADHTGERTIALNTGPGIDEWEIYHPRFASNNGRYVTVNGPYDQGNMGGNNIPGGGPHVEIYVGRFDAAVSQVEQWVKVTNNNEADFFADLWIEDERPSGPQIALSPSSLAFSAELGAGNPASRTVSVRNSGIDVLGGVDATEGAEWLSVSRSGSGNAQQITNSVDISSLKAGNYTATVTVGGGGATNTATYTVGLAVIGPPTLTSLTVVPANAWVTPSGSVALTAYARDQNGDPFGAPITWSVEPGGSVNPSSSGSSVSEHTTTFTSDGTQDDFEVTASSGGVSGRATITVSDQPPMHMKVNCGGGSQVVDGWEDDGAFAVGGAAFTFGGTTNVSGVAGAAPQDVYKTVRHQNHSYVFRDLADGAYTVRMHFVDGISSNRAMDYTIEGRKVIDDLDVEHEAGGLYKPLVKEFPVTVLDGNGLEIVCEKDSGNDVFEAGIEIIGGSSTGQPLEAGEIRLLEPAGGGTYKITGTMRVRWLAGSGVAGVTISISVDALTWLPITGNTSISTSDDRWGDFTWTIPDSIEGVSLESDKVLLRVEDYFYSDRRDETETPFAILSKEAAVQDHIGHPLAGPVKVRLGRRRLSVIVSTPGTHRVELIDPRGTVIYRAGGHSGSCHVWRLGSQAAGIYLLRVRTNSRMLSRKIIIAR